MVVARALALIAGFQLTLASCAGRAIAPQSELPAATVSSHAGGRLSLRLDSATCSSNSAISDAARTEGSRFAPRWPDRRGEIITVRIDDANGLAGWKPAFRTEVGNALDAWEDAGSPVKFAVTGEGDHADVRVHWIDKFDAHYEGWTTVTWDHTGSLVNGDVTLALHSPKGQLLTPGERSQVVLHEVGHVLGLSHSSSPASIMSPTIRVTAIAPVDIRSLRALYESSDSSSFSPSAAQSGSMVDHCSARGL